MSQVHRAVRRMRGVSLIEIIVVMAVAAVLLGSALPSLQQMLARRLVEGRADELAGDLAYARGVAVSRNEPVRISFHSSSRGSCYVIHTDDESNCSCDGELARCVNGAREIKTVFLPVAESVSLQAKPTSLLFDPESGTVSPAGKINIVGQSGLKVSHVVSLMGRVRSCSPADAKLAGYPTCQS